MADILPYANCGESISVNLGIPGVDVTALSDRCLLVDAAKLSGPFSVIFEAQLPSGIAEMFPPADRKSLPMEVVATFTSIDGSIRTHTKLANKKSSLYTGSIKLDPSIIAESARVRIYAVRSSNGKGVPGFAKHKGARLAWSPETEVRLADRPPPKGNYMDVRWEDFDSSTKIPSGFGKAFYYVDTESSPPILYLNKGARAALVKLVDTKGHGHAKALPRDVVLRSIAIPAWSTLIDAALQKLREEAEDGPVNFEEAFGGTWKGEVIEHIAPLLHPDRLPEDAIFEMCGRINDDAYFANLLARAQLAIQEDDKLLDIYGNFADGVFAHG